LKKNGEAHVTDEEMSGAAERWPHNTPMTKEHYFYRQIYEEFFHHPSCAKLVHPWLPLWQANLDPSGRSNDLHKTNTGDADAIDRAVEASV
jgi:asparagine synthase (glutamine-hydrolysing)